MHDFDISEKLRRILKKLSKKDSVRLQATLKKMGEIRAGESTEHYKNLSYEMKEFKRVHIDSHFVLVFRFERANKKIWFEDLQHHDTIYKR
ncbi:MAG: addiction module toxin RelE [Candidatus Diapherotrites archaeon]